MPASRTIFTAKFTANRGIAALMVVQAASLAVASALHLSGVDGHDATGAGIAEAVICVVLLGGAIAYRRADWGRPAAIAATGFAIAGFCYGLSLTARGDDLPDLVYHATVLPLLLVTMVLIIRARPPAGAAGAGASHQAPALVTGRRRG